MSNDRLRSYWHVEMKGEDDWVRKCRAKRTDDDDTTPCCPPETTKKSHIIGNYVNCEWCGSRSGTVTL